MTLEVPAAIALGVVFGLNYALIAIGLIVVYRSSRVLNFAHGEIGAFGAVVLAVLSIRWQVPYWLAFLAAIACSGVVAAIIELTVIRRLRAVPRVMSIIGTLGAGQFLLFLSFAIGNEARSAQAFPQPPFLPQFEIGPLRMTPAYIGTVVFALTVLVGFSVFRQSRLGRWLRASSDNLVLARLIGIPALRMSTLAWGIGGALAAVTAIFLLPSRGLVTQESLGPSLLLRALAPAVLGKLDNFAIATVAAIGLGITEQLVIFNTGGGGIVDLAIFLVIALSFLTVRLRRQAGEEHENWSSIQSWRRISLASLGATRYNIAVGLGISSVAVILLGPLFTTNRAALVFASLFALALIATSIAVVTGIGGELSLGQFAIAGIGFVASYQVTSRIGNFVMGIIAAGLVGGIAMVILGSLRRRGSGLSLAVITLGFAVMASSWLFEQGWMLGGGVEPGRPIIGPLAATTGKTYYAFSIVVFLLAFVLLRNVWRRGVGRLVRAVRDSPSTALAFGINTTLRRNQGLLVGGFLAGVGGAVFGHALPFVTSEIFSPVMGIQLVAMSALGGIGTFYGPLLGAAYIIGIPAFVELDAASLATSTFGWLVLVLYFPGGLAQLAVFVRSKALGLSPVSVTDSGLPKRFEVQSLAKAFPEQERLLVVQGLSKHFGAIAAVDDISLTLKSGELVGLVGTNGAGKTTLLNLISGFETPDEGEVLFLGESAKGTSPRELVLNGMVRSFQDLSLFPTLTVSETISCTLDAQRPVKFLAEVFGAGGSEKRKAKQSLEVARQFGLHQFFDHRIDELSTGTRRIVELACVFSLRPRLMLLDEPSSGIAQSETDALAELLRALASYSRAALILVEHNLSLVSSVVDRVVVMDGGKMIADGDLESIRTDQVVRDTYFGLPASYPNT